MIFKNHVSPLFEIIYKSYQISKNACCYPYLCFPARVILPLDFGSNFDHKQTIETHSDLNFSPSIEKKGHNHMSHTQLLQYYVETFLKQHEPKNNISW